MFSNLFCNATSPLPYIDWMPTNEDEFAPNSLDVVASVLSSKGYWDLLNSQCEDYFKNMNIGWMWQSWKDDIDSWGVKYLNGSDKWNWSAQLMS